MPRRLVLLVLALVTGCVDFSLKPPSPAPLEALRPVGVACTAAEQCSSASCRESVCCERECAATEICDAPGHVGSCTARPLGGACLAASDCPGHFCVDRVCCDQACQGDCRSCALPGSAGRCSVPADNTDPDQDCQGACRACFSGRCAPALVGSDPNGKCGGERACSSLGICRALPGRSCAVDQDCAAGSCVQQRCLTLEDVRLFTPEMNPASDAINVMGLAHSNDITALVVTDYARNVTVTEPILSASPNNLILLTLRDGEVVPEGHLVHDDQFGHPGRIPGQVEFLGADPYVVTFDATASQPFGGGRPCERDLRRPCGVYGQRFTRNGATGVEPIKESTQRVSWLQLVRTNGGDLFAAWQEDEELWFSRRGERGGWSGAQLLAPHVAASYNESFDAPLGSPALVALSGGVAAVYLDDSDATFHVALVTDDGVVRVADAPLAEPPPGLPRCTSNRRYLDGTALDGETLLFVGRCESYFLFGTFRTSTPAEISMRALQSGGRFGALPQPLPRPPKSPLYLAAEQLGLSLRVSWEELGAGLRDRPVELRTSTLLVPPLPFLIGDYRALYPPAGSATIAYTMYPFVQGIVPRAAELHLLREKR